MKVSRPIFTNSKSHTRFQLIPKMVILNDLEPRNDQYFTQSAVAIAANYFKLSKSTSTESATKIIAQDSVFSKYDS